MTTRMAGKLLEHGSRVYVIDNETNDSLNLLDIATLVNKRYLKHRGSYQRLLVIKAQSGSSLLSDAITYHYEESREGKKMARTIVDILKGKEIGNRSDREYTKVVTDAGDISFAKNVLPAITYIYMGSGESKDAKALKIPSNKNDIADLIANGILLDYSKLDFEDDE